MQKKIRMLYLSIALLLCFLIRLSSVSSGIGLEALESDKFLGIDFKNGLLKVSVENQNFNEIMYDVAEKAGMKMTLYCHSDRKLTVSFDYLPLENGLRLLLEGYNFVFKYHSREGDLSKNISSLEKVFVISKLKDIAFAETLGIGGIEKEALYERVMHSVKTKEFERRIKESVEDNSLITAQDPSSQVGQIEKVLIEKIKECGGVEELKKLVTEKSQDSTFVIGDRKNSENN